MKKLFCTIALAVAMLMVLQGCGSQNESAENAQPPEKPEASAAAESGITAEMAYEGVSNYCHSAYDWSPAESNPDIMYVDMGEETETEYQVIFRSYTGAVEYFYVDKASGNTRMVAYVPSLAVEEEEGTINLYDYLDKRN